MQINNNHTPQLMPIRHPADSASANTLQPRFSKELLRGITGQQLFPLPMPASGVNSLYSYYAVSPSILSKIFNPSKPAPS